ENGHRTVASPQKRSFLASLFSRDKDAEEADDNTVARESAPASRRVNAKTETNKTETNKPAAPARVQVASATEPIIAAQPVPLPPRRPIYQVAAAESLPAPAPAPRAAAPIQFASLSPNQIVNMRGLWDNTGDAVAASAPAAETNALSVSSARRIQTAPEGREVTASIGPFPNHDRVPADVALAYAAQTAGRSADRASTAVTSKG